MDTYNLLLNLKHQLENPDVPWVKRCDIMEFFLKYTIIFNQGMSTQDFFKDIKQLTQNICGGK